MVQVSFYPHYSDPSKKSDPAPEPAKEEPAQMEVESEESDVELDMDGVIGTILLI